MQLHLELVHIRKGESFAAWQHGYPFRTVRWHYHPEYEIHLVVNTSGTFYIGDYVGAFGPGQLIMTGPNLPQNWISDLGPEETVACRTEVIQFPQSFVDRAREAFPEMSEAEELFEKSRRGLLFDERTSREVRPLMAQSAEARGVARLGIFFQILGILTHARNVEQLASLSYDPDLDNPDGSAMNQVIAHLRDNLTEPINESELAEMAGQSPSAFSRSFKRHTGSPLVRFRNQLRIDLACKVLLSDPDAKIADLCFEVGFSNLSNFNRQFLKSKGMSPTEFRSRFIENETALLHA